MGAVYTTIFLKNEIETTVPSYVARDSFKPIQKHRKKYSFVYSISYVSRQQTRRQKSLN
jgi:hypothetical protein